MKTQQTSKQIYDKNYYLENKEEIKEKCLNHYYQKAKSLLWRKKENSRLRTYYTNLFKNPIERLKYNCYMRDYMRSYCNIPEINWRIR